MRDKPRVALFIRDFWPLQGGLQIHALRLCQELIQSGAEVEVFTRFVAGRHAGNDFYWKAEPSKTFDNEGVTTHVVGMSLWQRLFLLPLKKLRWRESTQPLAAKMVTWVFKKQMVSRLKDFDIVHYDGGGLELWGYAIHQAAMELNIPFCVQPSIHFGQWGHLPVDHHFFRLADAMLVHTQVEGDYLTSEVKIPSERVHVVGNGIDDCADGDGPAFRDKQGISAEAPMILFLGRLSEDKGYPLLLEAFKHVRKTIEDAVLVAVGPKSKALSHVDTQAEGVIETGFVSDQERSDAYVACDVFCVPSEGESFGLVFLEAGRARKPIVARNLDVLEELVGEANAGILIGDRKDDGCVEIQADELARALCQLLDSEEMRTAMGERGYQNAEAFFWPNIVKRFLKAYAAVLE